MTDSDTLRMLDDAARGFAAFDARRVRQWRDTPPGFDRHKWREMAEQGWFGILVGEHDGGLGLDLDAAAAVAKILGYNAMPEPFVAAGVLVPKLLASCPASPTRNALLASVVAGEKIATLAHLDTTGELAFGASGVRARKSGNHYMLNGEFRFVPLPDADVVVAPVVIDLAEEGEAVNLCRAELVAVDRAAAGVDIDRETMADGGTAGWVRFNNADVPADAVLASGDFWPQFEEALDYGVIANCAELLGIMERELELTLDYLKTRKQFGKSIGSFRSYSTERSTFGCTAKSQSTHLPRRSTLSWRRRCRRRLASRRPRVPRRVLHAPRLISATTASSCTARSVSRTNTISRST